MTLLDRMKCAVVDCARHRAPESLVCADHLSEMWNNKLDRKADGTFIVRRRFTPRDTTWLRA